MIVPMHSATFRSRRSRVRVVAIALLALAAAVAGREARAQSAQMLGERRALIERATRASTEGAHARALEFLARAGEISMTPSLRAFVAAEQVASGQRAAAVGTAERCVREATPDATLVDRERVLATCRGIVSRWRGRMARLNVRLPAGTPTDDAEVFVAGTTVAASDLGAPVFVEAGSVLVEARSRRAGGFRRRIDVSAGQDVTVAIEFRPNVQVATPATARPLQLTLQSHSPSPMPFVVLSLGGASLIVSGVMLGLHVGSVGSLNAMCMIEADNLRHCPTTASSIQASAEAFGTVGIVTLAVGAALVTTGVVWAALAGRNAQRERVTIGVGGGRGSGSVALALSF